MPNRDYMSYKGFIGTIEYDDKTQIFSSSINYSYDGRQSSELIRVTAKTLEILKTVFENAIDTILYLCKESESGG